MTDRQTNGIMFMVLGFGILLLVLMSILQGNRIDDLEQRVTTFETVRIEIVAPPEGVSP